MSTVGLELTNKCPWRCETCLPSSGQPRTRELVLDRWLYLLRLLRDEGFSAICLSGGEPLDHEDVGAVIAEAAALGLGTSVFTSGSGLSQGHLRILRDAGTEVVVSLDGADEALHDLTRGAGSFAVATGALQLLSAAGVRRSVTATVTRRNLTSLDALVAVADQFGASRLTLNEIVHGGRAREHWSELGLQPADRMLLRDWFRKGITDWPGARAPDADDACWVDGTSLYVTSQGRCYTCSEIAQFRPRQHYGAISGEPESDRAILAKIRATDLRPHLCRYDVSAGGRYLLVLDSPRPCIGLDVVDLNMACP